MKYISLILVLVIFGCNEDEALQEQALLNRMEEIQIEIDQLVDSSCSETSECKYMAIGAKACGGPTHYIIYSSGTNEAKLTMLVSEYTEANSQYNALVGVFSDCALVNPPIVECVSGECTEMILATF